MRLATLALGTLLTTFSISGKLQAYDLNGRTVPSYTKVGFKKGDRPIPTRPATITYPAGRFTITDKIILGTGGILRGAGAGKTILYFPKPLVAMGYPCSQSPDPKDCWDWAGGVIEIMNANMAGVEDLTIEFPEHYYTHHQGQGFNGIYCGNCTHTWVKNVEIKNSDVGIGYIGGQNNTIKSVVIRANPRGSHLLTHFTNTSRNLMINFVTAGSTEHGLAGNWGGSRNVFSNGYMDPIMLEPNHAWSNQPQTSEFLYSNIQGTRKSLSDGNGNSFGGAFFWNVGEKKSTPEDVYVDQMVTQKGIDPRQ